jgi:F-type H+-transporting ATPase subunit b
MPIDGFTVAAQVLNFLILAWLLKRFLYRPILDALDAREQRIASELADADAKRAEADHARTEFQGRIDAFEQQRTALMSEAREDAAAERRRLVKDARRAADDLQAKRRESLASESRSLNRVITRRAQQEVLAIARKALTDLADAKLEAAMCNAFLRRLQSLDGPARAAIATSLAAGRAPALIRSVFELSETQRIDIQQALEATFATEIHLRFETTPELVSGIEFTTDGQKLAWSIADYMASLEAAIADLTATQDSVAAGEAGSDGSVSS